jgi:hypothetical protein
MCQLTKNKLILACPVEDNASNYEVWLASWFKNNFGSVPQWLSDHVGNGLPSLNEVISLIDETNYHYSFIPNEGIYEHYAAVVLDHMFPFLQNDLKHHLVRSPQTSLISGSDWDKAYSYIFCVNINHTRQTVTKSLYPVKDMGPSSMPFGLYSFYHSGVKPIEQNNYINILCGSDGELDQPSGIIKDIPKNTPRLCNKRWSELSGIYKIWVDQDLPPVIGLSHYRRILLPSQVNEHNLITNSRTKFLENASQLDTSIIRNKCLTESIIYAPIPVNLGCSIYKQYCMAHNENDFATMIDILTKRRPEFLGYIPSLFHDSEMHCWNIVTLKLEWFNDLCELWFSILIEFESLSPMQHRGAYQARDISFLAERLCHLWLVSSTDRLGANIVQAPVLFHGNIGSSGFCNSKYEDIDLNADSE